MVFNGLENGGDSMYLGLNAGNTCRSYIELAFDELMTSLNLKNTLNSLK